MKLESSYPVICTDKIAESRDFYMQHFNFEPTFEDDWYVSLKSRDNSNYELALLDFRHPSLPENFRKPTTGMLINFEVSNVDETYEDLKSKQLPMILEIKSEDWGQRHFITTDPNGILIDVIQNTKPSAAYAEHYSG